MKGREEEVEDMEEEDLMIDLEIDLMINLMKEEECKISKIMSSI